jgi:Flp pilus assembly protein TadD
MMKYLSQQALFTFLVILVFALTGCSSRDNKQQMGLKFDPQTRAESIQKTLNLALLAEQNNKLDQAIIYYIKVLEFDSNNAQVLYKIGAIQQKLGNAELANRAFGKALLVDSDHIGALTAMGIVSLRQKAPEKAKKLLARAIELDQQRLNTHGDKHGYIALDSISPLQAYNVFGVLYDLAGAHQDARELFILALKVNKHSPSILSNLGYSYYLSRNFMLAQSYFKKAIDNDPNFARAKTNLGLIYVRNGQYHRAIQLLQQVMTEAEAYNDVGYLLMLEGRYKQAQYFLQQAIERSAAYFVKGNANLDNVRVYLKEAQDVMENNL